MNRLIEYIKWKIVRFFGGCKGRWIYFDVDGTLVDKDDKPQRHVGEALKFLRNKGFYMVCWSMGGRAYAQATMNKWGWYKYFDLFLDKPHMIVDDDPELLLKACRIFRVDEKNVDWWANIKERLFKGSEDLDDNGLDWEEIYKTKNK